jgi:hypothetical protein
VGSVIRSQPHDDLAPNQATDTSARRGRVGSFILVRSGFKEAREVIPLPPQLLEMLGSRHSRLHHCVWHGTRDNWSDPEELEPDKSATVKFDEQKYKDAGGADGKPVTLDYFCTVHGMANMKSTIILKPAEKKDK